MSSCISILNILNLLNTELTDELLQLKLLDITLKGNKMMASKCLISKLLTDTNTFFFVLSSEKQHHFKVCNALKDLNF